MKWWSRFGLIKVEERIWRSLQSNYLRPFTAVAKVSARCKSRALQRVLTDFGMEHSFGQANMRLHEHYGFELSASAVRDVTLEHAGRASTAMEKRYAGGFRELPAKGPAHIVGQMDGSMICTVEEGRKRKGKSPREWKEIRLCAAQDPESLKTCYAAGFNHVDEAGRRWAHCAKDVGWGLESRIHVVADGAQWIRLQSEEVFGDDANVLTDFYHVSEYLAAAAPVCRPHAHRYWFKVQQRRLKRGAWESVVATMEPFAETADIDDKDAPVRTAIRYMTNRSQCLDYPRAIKEGLPIGSGLIESAHKHVLQARLKKAGCAWLERNAHAMAQVRVMRANGLWDQLWENKEAA